MKARSWTRIPTLILRPFPVNWWLALGSLGAENLVTLTAGDKTGLNLGMTAWNGQFYLQSRAGNSEEFCSGPFQPAVNLSSIIYKVLRLQRYGFPCLMKT